MAMVEAPIAKTTKEVFTYPENLQKLIMFFTVRWVESVTLGNSVSELY